MVGLRGANAPLVAIVMYFCIHNCMSASNDYKAVACSNNNQAQLHTHISVPYWSPDVCLGLELLRDIQFGLPAILKLSTKILLCVSWMHLCDRKWAWQPKIFSGWTLLSEFLNPPLIHPEQTQPSWCTTPAKWIVHDWPDVLYSELCPPPPPTYLFSELLCGLCGQEPEAIQRQCHGEFFFVL